jgi:hypothetical protein
MDDSARVDDICDRIEAALQDDDGNKDILDALITLFTFHMSLLCPDCRKRVAHDLKRCIPAMLADANREAAQRADHGVPAHTCH